MEMVYNTILISKKCIMDTNINNYEVNELLELIALPKKSYYTLEEIEKHVTQCIKQVQQVDNSSQSEQSTKSEQSKKELNTFLVQSFQKICEGLNIDYGEDKLETLNSFTENNPPITLLPKLPSTEILNEGDHSIINHVSTTGNPGFTVKLERGVINPFLKQAYSFLVNLNTRFRSNYFKTKSTDFIYQLPNPLRNIAGMKLLSAELPDCIYNFSSVSQTNEFTVQIFDVSGSDPVSGQQEITIKVRDGLYSADELADYLNKFVFTEDNSLNRIACEAHPNTCKFRFFYDVRDISMGGAGPLGVPLPEQRFNIDFRLNENKNRPIQLNMGWILGYKQPYYSWDENYVLQDKVSYNRFEGYNPESTFDKEGARYFLLSVDEYTNNYVQTIVCPFQEGTMKNSGLLAKIENNPRTASSVEMDLGTSPRREYFGPVNIDRLHIQLFDQFGNLVDLNNRDYSLSLEFYTMYDL